jgi:hypothetical protein
MNNPEPQEMDDAVLDLGAATETTLGIDDPIMSEDLLHIRMRDFG